MRVVMLKDYKDHTTGRTMYKHVAYNVSEWKAETLATQGLAHVLNQDHPGPPPGAHKRVVRALRKTEAARGAASVTIKHEKPKAAGKVLWVPGMRNGAGDIMSTTKGRIYPSGGALANEGRISDLLARLDVVAPGHGLKGKRRDTIVAYYRKLFLQLKSEKE